MSIMPVAVVLQIVSTDGVHIKTDEDNMLTTVLVNSQGVGWGCSSSRDQGLNCVELARFPSACIGSYSSFLPQCKHTL